MSYTPKQGNSSGSGGGNVNPNQINQQTKATLAGIANMQQQMQNLVNQSPQTPSLNAFFNLQQQNLIKQQMILQNTQFLQQLQQQQQQQQTQPPIQQNLPGKEPLALTRTPNAAEILNKTFQQQANGSAVGANLQNVAQFSQHLQAFGPNTANLMQQLQAYQYQIQQQNQPQHQSHQQQNKMQQQPYVQQNTTGHHNQQQYQQNYQQQQKFSAPSSSSQQNLPSAQQQQSHQQQQQSINKSNQNLGNQITKPPNLPAATQITPIPPPSVSTSQQQSNNSQNKNQTKPQVTMTPTTIGKSSSQHSSNKPAGASSSFMANRTIANPYAKGAHGLYQNTSTLNFKTGSSKLPPPTQITAVPLTKPTIATSSPIKTSMPTGSNASSPRSGHTPPAVNIPPKSITPPVSIIPSSVTPLPPKGVSITPGKPQTGHPIPTAIPAPIPAAVVAASATSILTVPPPIQPSVHQVTPEVLLTSTVCAQKSSSPPKLTDVPIASKGENLLQINKETSTAPSSKTESSDIKIEDAAKDKKNNEEKKQEKDKFEEKQNNITESKSKNETITESKNVDLKTTEIESSVSKDSPKDCEKSENKKENERNANKQNESKTEVVPKDNKEKSTSEIKTQEKDKKTEIKQLETKELPKTQDASSKIEEKKASISENVQTNNKKEDNILPEKKSDNEKISPKNTLLPLDKVVQKTSDKQVGSGLEKSVEKPIEKGENSSDKIISKTAKKETTNTIKPLGKSGEKDNDKNVITSPSEHVVKKQEESSQKEEKSIDNNITEVTEEKSQKIEKNTSTIRNTQQQQQKNKSLDSSKVDKHKTDSKKKNSSTNNTTVKDNPIRAKLTKSTVISVDKERSSIKEPESSKQTTDNSNLTDLKDKGNSSDTNKIENANSQSTPVKIPQENLSEVVKSSSNTETPKDETGSSRSKRHRLKTILYQSPLPELAFITKLSASEASNSPKPGSANEDKLVLFYKNEYLAVRNAEGGFFLCQALHNVYKTSPRIRIRWLSEEKSEKSIYIPDFYDNTDIECVLTTVDLNKVSRDRFKLPEHEKDRIENILKKAIDVEKGILPRPDITEENPDGLDISLYTDESQIEKKKRNSKSPRRNSQSKKVASSSKKKSKSKSPSKSKSNAKRKRNDNDTDNSEEDDEEENNDKEYKPSHKKRIVSENQEDQTIRRLQRSPLAKARAASPITLRKQTLKSVPQKSSESTPSSRESRAAKRRATDSGNEDATPNKKAALTPSKKPSDKKISNKKEENEDPLSLPESGQNAKSGNLKKSKTTTSVTSSSSSPVSEKAPNNSTSSTPTGAVRTTRSRK